ncbi:hypothetical protein M407DRAFT_32858 [Tulasnella calospora MUT 4182]|uniref:Uncharacterized protein n=1 Tax=Tulasnella calospora MUT 4182 TaxID=1051891 RepID=A0A0C3Q3A2_9AGAM|nr:hypothetical protein M407DRAFT_32858 [Tulasnella calospora MUT 4182]
MVLNAHYEGPSNDNPVYPSSAPKEYAQWKPGYESNGVTIVWHLRQRAEILRLSNFPPNVIASLRTLFQQQLVYRADREDPEMGVSEFIMADRLWSSKNVKTERLVTLIFSVILSHRFRRVTAVAYGRLAQATQSLVFSKAVPGSLEVASSSRVNSPAVPASPLPMSSGSTGEGARPEHRTCVALSLTQKTLRVICAPKGSTPAILASVRSAWPRDVISEGRPEEDVYEFQLKGYSPFSTSTFDRDALVHIFGLLRALDTHAFQLITNLNLTQGIAKSRTKDLWIFDCPADPPSPPHSQHAPLIVGGGGGDGRSPHSSPLGVPNIISKRKEPERALSVATTATSAGFAGSGAPQTPRGGHPDSEYLYKQYVPAPPPSPPPAGPAPPAVIYSTAQSNEGHTPPSLGSQSPGTEEGLLSSDAFRETAYSGPSEASRDAPVTWTGTNSTPASPIDS